MDVEDKAPIERDVEIGQTASHRFLNAWTRTLLGWGVESRGILPVPIEQRNDTRLYQIFFLWFSWNFNILSFSAGTLAPAFGLGLRDACLTIFFFNLICCIPPAYFSTWGPKLGLRQMCQARYSFGYFGVILPSVLNIISMLGFCVLNCILGGQTLSAVSEGSLSWTVGIVVISVTSIFISFCGIHVVTWYERLAWIPVFISILVALGVGGKHLDMANTPSSAPAFDVLSFASVIAGFVITYSPLGSDYTTYLHHAAPGWKIFLCTYLGLFLPITSLQIVGAASSITALSYTPWAEAFNEGDVGSLVLAMLRGTGTFGKCLTVLLSLSVVGNVAPTIYSFGLSFQVFVPWSAKVPRYLFSVLAAAIILPLAIVGAHRFYTTLNNFLSVIGYWASAFAVIILIEHLLFRSGDFERYDLTAWNSPGRLPPGIAALGAGILSMGLVVPCMAQIWYVGPIGEKTGDIGFEVAFFLSGILYVPLRAAEKKVFGR